MGVEQVIDQQSPQRVPSVGLDGLLKRHRFSVADYHAMADAGILTQEDKVELLDGEIVKKMTIHSPHASCVDRLNYLFVRSLGDRAVVRVQNPVQLDDWSEPEPDVSLLRPKGDFYAAGHPMPPDVYLIIEVADTSLARDRFVKTPLYARAGVRELWIINLPARCIVCHRQPSSDGYREIRTIDEGTLSPVAFPELELEIAELLG